MKQKRWAYPMKKSKLISRSNKKKYNNKFSNSRINKMAFRQQMRMKRLKDWKIRVAASRPHTKVDKVKVAASRKTVMSKMALITTKKIMKVIQIIRVIKKMIECRCTQLLCSRIDYSYHLELVISR